jgi:hypothetical protein
MNFIYVIVFAFPVGYLVRDRGVAITGFLAGGALVFAYQAMNEVMDWLHGSDAAFGQHPTSLPTPIDNGHIIGYGLVNLISFVVGVALVWWGGHVATRRQVKRDTVTVG